MVLSRRVLEWIVFALLWLLLVFQTSKQQLVAAAAAALLTVIGISTGSRHLRTHFAVPDGWLAALARLPWKIVTDTGRVFVALFRQIIQRDRTVGRLMSVPFDYGRQQPEDSARLAVALFGISITPNTVAIATSPDGVLIHQLEPTSGPVGRSDPRWPV